jgi:alpha-beta hydrolase superfamily lysophospholipase
MNAVNYITIKQKDGYTTKLTQFTCDNKPKASILILIGMAEHQKRYYEFAKFLTELGLDVYLYDHRGHGLDKKLSELGYFAPNKGYELVIDDAINVSNYIIQNNRCNKLFLMGHSMGSFIARNIIQTFDKYTGVILSGTGYRSGLTVQMGLIVTCVIKTFKGPKHISPYMNNLLFGSKRFTKLSERTAFDWLSRSNTVVGAYINDPYCGFICTASFYHDLLKLTSNAAKKKLIRQTKIEMPILIISGENDPVCGYGKEIKKLVSVYKSLGFNNVTYKLYPDCRHELLNELNKEDVYTDIYQWMSKRI